MKIEVWSDFICPFCYLGKRRLEEALEQFKHKESVTIEYKSYQLDPAGTYIEGKDFFETFSEIKGISMDQAKKMNEEVAEQAKTVGLEYKFDTMQYSNTFDAHRLCQYAAREGKREAMTERLLHACFIESKRLSDIETLVKLAVEVGLDEEATRQVLQTQRFTSKVKEDIAVAEEMGVQSVPYFVFNEKYAVPGVQPREILSQVIEKVWEEEPKVNTKKAKTTYCTDEGCVEL